MSDSQRDEWTDPEACYRRGYQQGAAVALRRHSGSRQTNYGTGLASSSFNGDITIVPRIGLSSRRRHRRTFRALRLTAPANSEMKPIQVTLLSLMAGASRPCAAAQAKQTPGAYFKTFVPRPGH